MYINYDVNSLANVCLLSILKNTLQGAKRNRVQGPDNFMEGIFILWLRVSYVLRAIFEGENFDAVF